LIRASVRRRSESETRFATHPHLALVSGRYEGIDERVHDLRADVRLAGCGLANSLRAIVGTNDNHTHVVRDMGLDPADLRQLSTLLAPAVIR
jgi:hypothetical protein